MKTFLLAVFVGLFIMLFTLLAITDAKAFSSVEIVSLENQYRSKPLVVDPSLSYIAQRRVEVMAAKDSFSHNLEGKRSWDYLKLYRYSYLSAGENLAKGFKTDKGLVNAWLVSPTHRANIMNPLFTKTGFGFSGKYTVQLFVQ